MNQQMLTMFANLAGVKPDELQTLLMAVNTFVTQVPLSLQRIEDNQGLILQKLDTLLGADPNAGSNDDSGDTGPAVRTHRGKRGSGDN